MRKSCSMRRAPASARWMSLVLAGCGLILCGCNPVTTAVKLGTHVVGAVVDDESTQQLGRQLIGQPPAAADRALGQRLDVLRDVHSSREWLIYPVKLDVLGKKRYVVETTPHQIVGVQMVERGGGKTGIPQKLIYEAKVKGKPMADCERALGLGPPLLTVRSVNTGQLGQLFDARLVKSLPKPCYCVLKYDVQQVCTEVDLVEVAASAK